MGGRRRSLWSRPTTARRYSRPRAGLRDGGCGQPARAHPCRPDPRRCAARADPGTCLADTLRRRRRLDRQRVSTPLRRTAARHPPHPGKPAGLVTMAKTTPIPSPTIPVPTTRTPMISIYGCSTSLHFGRRSFRQLLAVTPTCAKCLSLRVRERSAGCALLRRA